MPAGLETTAKSVPFTDATETGVSTRNVLVRPSFFISKNIVPCSTSSVRELDDSINSNWVFSLILMTDLSSIKIATIKPSSPTLIASPLLIPNPGLPGMVNVDLPIRFMSTLPSDFMILAMGAAPAILTIMVNNRIIVLCFVCMPVLVQLIIIQNNKKSRFNLVNYVITSSDLVHPVLG